MVSAEFEGQLAAEGATGSAEAQLAFQEAFALAEGVAAKRALVEQSFVPGSPDFWFYSALCTTLEVQALAEGGELEQAWQRLSEGRDDLQTAERELTSSHCWRRAQRIERRRLMLELELTYKLKRPEDEISNVTQRVTTALQVSHYDPEPAGVTTEARKETYPTTLKAELLDLDSIIENKLTTLRISNAVKPKLRAMLNDLDVFGREKVFQKICAWDGSEFEHWKMLELFLDSYAFEFADIPGYVDIIVKDAERRKEVNEAYTFNFRAAHQKLSFQQLLECARQAPDLFRSNYEFAVRGIQLLRAVAEVDSAQCSDLRSETLNMKELQHIATYLEFLHDFTPMTVNKIQVLILYRKLELMNVIYWTSPSVVTELLNSLVEYVKLAGGPALEAMYGFEVYGDSAASASSLLVVEPRQQLSISLNALSSDEGVAKTVVQIPNELRAAQMMLRIREIPSSRTTSSVAPPIDIIRPYFNSSLNVEIMTQCGVLQVLRDGLPVRSCYVKVYAKVSSSGSHTKTEFYKDGYTDLLGKFDYVGINGDLITNVQKFSILVSHEKFGATVEQVDPPVLASTVGDYSGKEERELLLY
ncbi:Actin-binding protein F [Phytophthora cinnamomi]|uniref:Actin-binding protein F n=1 Tax=Phytophthora cinnamomi TaxID=4785 RepID=UPI00355AB473|nr:Actin-binding protein F [Phytophthora cinnamomi]